MQIKFLRSGGFAGAATNVAGTVEFTAHGAQVSGKATGYHRDLSAQEVEKLLAAAVPSDLEKVKQAASSTGPIRDGYQFEITVAVKGGPPLSLTLGQGLADQMKAVSPAAAYLGAWIEEEADKIWNHRVNSIP